MTELKLLEEADAAAGLVLFDVDDDLLDGADPLGLSDEEEFLSVVVDSEWEAELAEGFELDDIDDDIEFEVDEEDEDDEWLSEEYADLRAELELLHGGEDADDFPFDFDPEDDDDPEVDLSFLEDDDS